MEKRPGARSYFSRRGLNVGGVEHELFAGAMHYWRLDRNDWRPCLVAMKNLGLSIVETYVPWSVHELAEGEYDWARDLDLGAFLDEVAAQDMLAIVRPGPHVNAELTLFGFPERILLDERVLAKTARDTPVWLPAPPRMFPVPSYASSQFRREVAAWFDEMARPIVPRLAPNGPVVAVGVDNESQMFFRLGAYDHDYHADALVWWREFAGDVEPPRRWAQNDAERCVRWVQFKEEYTRRSLAWVAEELGRVGLQDLAMFHNLPPSAPSLVCRSPIDSAPILIGSDFYHQAKDYSTYRRRARYLVGSARTLPFAPEIAVGGPPWLPPMSIDDQKNVLLGLLASGVRAFNLYMAVDRDRWYGAPISATGVMRDPGPWLAQLTSCLRAVDWTNLREHKPLALIATRCESRYAIASSIADPLTPVVSELLGLGPAGAAELSRDEAARTHRLWLDALEQALARAQVPYDIVDERCTASDLSDYAVVVLPTLDRVDAELWQALHTAAAAGVRVVLGPGRPTVDEMGKPLAEPSLPARAGLMRAGSLSEIDDLAADLVAVVGELPDEWATANKVPVDCSIFADPNGDARVLFVANRSREFVTAEIVAVDGARLRDPFSRQELVCQDGVIAVGLLEHQVRLFVMC